MASQRFLVLGGAGLIGRTLTNRLRAQGHELFFVDLKSVDGEDEQHSIRANAFERNTIIHVINEVQPQVVVNCINLATIFSGDPQKGYDELIHFYLNLYRALLNLGTQVHYLQMGTTGSGGLGLNIPFTHGGRLEELPIINKAAFAGISTMMLTLLSRSFPSGMVRVSEIKPGLAIFAPGFLNSEYAHTKLVTVDGGESGHYTYNELALLTNYMGFTTVENIVDKVMEVLAGLQHERTVSSYDVIENLNQSIIAPSHEDQKQRDKVLRDMKKAQGRAYVLGTGNLGPPSVARDLIFGYLYQQYPPCKTPTEFKQLLKRDPSIAATLAYIHEKHPDLFKYVEEECTFKNYQLIHDYYRPGAEPWQTAAASLSKNPHITKVD